MFDPVVQDEARYNDGRLEEAVECLVDKWIADESDEVIEECFHAASNLDMEEVGALLFRLYRTPSGSLLGSDVMAKLYAIAKRVYSTVDEKLNERACDVIEAGQ